MKTVKTSLANMQGKLSRTQMKNVNGGMALVSCTYTINGVQQTQAMADTLPPGFSSWQDYADAFCAADVTCDDVDCNG